MTGLDAANATFWDELCGSALARRIGVTDGSPASLRRFDDAYMGLYPYLPRHLDPILRRKGRTLEIGLGYGTVSALIAGSGADLHGLDIAQGPVDMVRGRLAQLGQGQRADQVVQGSAVAIPWPDRYFDAVVSIGCLHHTGNLTKCIDEVARVLTPGGLAMIMVYNRNSLRQLLILRPRDAVQHLRGNRNDAATRAAYDANEVGDPAPFVEFTSARAAKQMFSGFREVHVARENMDPIPRLGVKREQLLGWPARLAGLDLYISATK